MLYAPGKEYVLYSYRLHNGKKIIEAFFPFCRYPTKEFICQRFDAARAVLIHDLADNSYYFVREQSNQVGRFTNAGDFLLDNCGDFQQSREFEFHNPHVSAITQGEKGWTCHITENPAHHYADHNESTDSGDDEHPNECFEYSD